MSPNTGKALDLGGFAIFTFLAIFCGVYAAWAFALAFVFGALAFAVSFRVWFAPDWVEVRFNRTWCAILAVLSALTFIAALLVMVFA